MPTWAKEQANWGSASTTVAFGDFRTPGSVILAFEISDSGTAPSASVTDSDNTYTFLRTIDDTDGSGDTVLHVWRAVNSGTGAGNLTFSTSAAHALIEYTADGGATAVDVQVHDGNFGANTAATDNMASPAILPPADGSLIAAFGLDDTGSASPTAGTGFTSEDGQFLSGRWGRFESLSQVTAASIAATWTAGAIGRSIRFVAALGPEGFPPGSAAWVRSL